MIGTHLKFLGDIETPCGKFKIFEEKTNSCNKTWGFSLHRVRADGYVETVAEGFYSLAELSRFLMLMEISGAVPMPGMQLIEYQRGLKFFER